MIKDIPFTSQAAVPSPYESPDGDLAVSYGLLSYDDALHPIPAPSPMFRSADCRLILVHRASSQANYIYLREFSPSGFALFFNAVSGSPSDVSPDSLSQIGSSASDAFSDIQVVGNILVVASSSGTSCYFWDGSSYVGVGSSPFVPIEFGIQRQQSSLSFTEALKAPTLAVGGADGSGASSTHPSTESASKAEYESAFNAVMGGFLSAVSEQVLTQGYFYQPFYVRYAFKLFDGNYAWHSAPALMLPTVNIPLLKIRKPSADGEYTTMYLDLDYVYKFALRYRILGSIPSQWKDVISSVDIFVTAPIYTYNQSKVPSAKRLVTSYSSLLGYSSPGFPRGRASASASSVSTYLDGVYSVLGGNSNPAVDDNYADHTFTSSDRGSVQCWEVAPNENFSSDIVSANLFYKIASIPFADVSSMSAFADVPLETTNLSTLQSRPVLKDDYMSHFSLRSAALFAYNSRINVAPSSIGLAMPFPLRSLGAKGAPSASRSPVTITVFSKRAGLRSYVQFTDSLGYPALAANFPRYLYYPDPQAYRMVLSQDGSHFSVDLKSHDFLNGAYWYAGEGAGQFSPPPAVSWSVPADAGTCGFYPVKGKLFTSEVENPLYFPPENINTIGSGSIIALSAATMALSQGQFGQFPLYALCTDGVWALSVSSTGGYESIQPICRDVCLSRHSVGQTDSHVVFAANKGIIMLAGSQAQCISHVIESDSPFSVSSLPNFSAVCSLMDQESSAFCSLAPFSRFLADCRFLFDYSGQKLVAFNDSLPYAYAFSLRSMRWGMMPRSFSYAVNAFPDSLAVDSSGLVLNASGSSAVVPKQLLVSRPFKLESPDVLKTVSRLFLRGFFPLVGAVSLVLYASRDLSNWQLVRSADSHILRGFSGTPYKYFRVVAVCSLQRGHSLRAASFDFSPRLANQMR